tara:strand:+ start:1847 stop:2185 length:339 start_codon:yes stop_codon:yes gene_type:complete
MRKTLIILFFIMFSFNSYSQKSGVEYYIKGGYAIAFSKECFNRMMDTVGDGDLVAFKKLSENGCMALFDESTKGKVHVYLSKREGIGYAKYRIKGTTDNFVWLVNEAIAPVN